MPDSCSSICAIVTGLTQLVFDADDCGKPTLEESRKIRSEWVLSIRGAVAARAANSVNPKLPTGDIEFASNHSKC
jgi:aspartyl-tRNA synthetase